MPVMDVILGDLSYTLGIGGSHTFLRLAGNLGGNNAAKLGLVFRKAMAHLRGNLFLSLQGCHSIDAEVLAFFAQQKSLLIQRSLDMVLIEVPAEVQKTLDGSHWAGLGEILPSLREAQLKYGFARN